MGEYLGEPDVDEVVYKQFLPGKPFFCRGHYRGYFSTTNKGAT